MWCALHTTSLQYVQDERSGMQEGIAAVEAARQQESVPPQEADIQQAYPGSSAVHGLAHSLQGRDC